MILVTGAGGKTGKAVLRALVARAHRSARWFEIASRMKRP
jgi:uncharacterized protein YbjT (DUF2867 family)